MSTPTPDQRSPERIARDEQIAAEPMLPPPNLPVGATPKPMEMHRTPRRPLAVAGVVENGVIRLLDAGVHLPERSRVIVVAEAV